MKNFLDGLISRLKKTVNLKMSKESNKIEPKDNSNKNSEERI